MSFEGLINIKNAISTLNPKEVREMSDHPLRIGLHAPNPAAYERLEDFFLGELTPARPSESADALSRVPVVGLGQSSASQLRSTRFDLSVYDAGLAVPQGAFIFQPERASL